ncbi:MAG TPA: hypothetical protein VGB84_01000 [Arachidicoccus sp.]
MKKLLFSASALLILFASCSKDNNSANPPSDSDLIQATWQGVSYVKTGYIKGMAISTTDTSLNPVFKTASLTFKSTSVADSINGTAGTDHSIIVSGIYKLNTSVTPDSISATLNGLSASPLSIAGTAKLSATQLSFTESKKETVTFGDQQSDSTVTVYSFTTNK